MATSKAATGRPRDPDIDAAVLAAARSLLATHGYEAMSVVAVADAAGTTRQAIYRRWATKADLATAAIASLSQADQRPDTSDPFADLVLELGAYYQGVTRPNGISMVGSMLQDATDPDLKALFRQRIVEPRRERLRHIFQRCVDAGLLDPDCRHRLRRRRLHRHLLRSPSHRQGHPQDLAETHRRNWSGGAAADACQRSRPNRRRSYER